MYIITLTKILEDGFKAHTVYRENKEDAVKVAEHWEDALELAQGYVFVNVPWEERLSNEIVHVQSTCTRLEIKVEKQ